MEGLYYRELGEGKPMVILHGLFGSSDNWLTLGKRFAEAYKVYLIDQRNHGQSFHDDQFDYAVMAADLAHFFKQEKIAPAIVLGHSMGGKTAMEFAMNHQSLVDRLIVADIAPKSYPVHHHTILKGLFAIDLEKLGSRKEADEILGRYVPEVGVRQFLLKNLTRNDQKKFTWRINLPVIAREIEAIGKGLNQNYRFDKPTLFIRGGRSDYIKGGDTHLIHSIFSDVFLQTIENAGHWLHAEQPDVFYRHVMDFLHA